MPLDLSEVATDAVIAEAAARGIPDPYADGLPLSVRAEVDCIELEVAAEAAAMLLVATSPASAATTVVRELAEIDTRLDAGDEVDDDMIWRRFELLETLRVVQVLSRAQPQPRRFNCCRPRVHHGGRRVAGRRRSRAKARPRPSTGSDDDLAARRRCCR